MAFICIHSDVGIHIHIYMLQSFKISKDPTVCYAVLVLIKYFHAAICDGTLFDA